MSRSATIPHRQLYCASTSVTQIEEAVLIRHAQGGSTAAFDVLVRRYDRAILRLALRFTDSEQDAQDIYQEAFLRAYRNIGKLRSESSFYTWMHRIVTNLCMDRLRKRRSLRETAAVITTPDGGEFDLFEHLADAHSAGDPERHVLRQELGRHIRIALKRLSARERVVFQLKHFAGLKLRTIGEMLNTSEETAKNTLFRARHKLRSYLTQAKQTMAERAHARRSGSMAWSK
jgi:RNA polymerase sigma-70 factor (ECF subfamily)